MANLKRMIINGAIQIPYSELQFRFARSSGKGGQNVNKVNSKAIMTWNPLESESLPDDVKLRLLERHGHRLTAEGELQIQSERFRDQPQNIRDCLTKLAQILSGIALPPKKRIATRPSRAAKKKRLETKRRHSEKKKGRRKGEDFD